MELKYISTSVAVSPEEEKEIKPLSVEKNMEYILYLKERVKSLRSVESYKTTKSIPVRLPSESKPHLDELKSCIKKLGLSFSDVYRQFYKDFTRGKK